MKTVRTGSSRTNTKSSSKSINVNAKIVIEITLFS